MDIGSIMLIASSGILVCILLSRPFFMQQNERADQHPHGAFQKGEHEHSFLLAEKERVLTALRDLDFDNLLEKIPAEDYATQRTELLRQGAGILKQLDSLEEKIPGQTSRKKNGSPEKNGRDQSRRVSSLSDEENNALEDIIALHRNSQKEKAAGFCPGCGKPIHKTDQFCPRCGREI